MIKLLKGVAYIVVLGLGIHAAYKGDLVVAMFFAIVFASENIAVSIDYWPRLQKGKIRFEQAQKGASNERRSD